MLRVPNTVSRRDRGPPVRKVEKQACPQGGRCYSCGFDIVGTIVTIDGPAGAGKSTVARRLARRLGVAYLDTGAMYRAITLAALEVRADMTDGEALGRLAATCEICFVDSDDGMRLLLDGRDMTAEIRSDRVTANARFIADSPAAKAELGRRQRAIAEDVGSLVTEGRDQGTAVFPDAEVKIFLTASPHSRAQRRVGDAVARGETADLDQVRDAIEKRDAEDAARKVGPLKKAADAIEVDTTDLNIEQVVDKLVEIVGRRNTDVCQK